MKLPKGSCFLFGPRGTGKSTWIEAELPDALHVDLLDQATFLELTGHAERLGAMADARQTKVIVIDEVQKLPAFLDEVHRLIETRRFRFVLTGSSARKLRRSGTNLLAGRARTVEMHPFTASELKTRWKLAHAIRCVCATSNLMDGCGDGFVIIGDVRHRRWGQPVIAGEQGDVIRYQVDRRMRRAAGALNRSLATYRRTVRR